MTMPIDPVIAPGTPDLAPGTVIEPQMLPPDGGILAPEGGPLTGKPRSMFVRGWEVFAENKLALVGLGILIFMVLFCFVGPLIYHTNQTSTNIALYACHPSSAHLLGCDDVGYDQLGRLMVGGQSSLEVGVAAAIVACLFGTLYGAFSGFIGGFGDTVMMRIVDAGLSIPFFLVVIILSVIFHPDKFTMIFIIAVFYWFGVARLIRGETLSLRTREYVQAVKVAGGRDSRAVVRHVVPNCIGTVIVQATFAVADSILILASLGFLGFGLNPPATDWGYMLQNGLIYINDGYWWLIYPPGICIILTVVAINLIGDALRDAFETRLQRR